MLNSTSSYGSGMRSNSVYPPAQLYNVGRFWHKVLCRHSHVRQVLECSMKEQGRAAQQLLQYLTLLRNFLRCPVVSTSGYSSVSAMYNLSSECSLRPPQAILATDSTPLQHGILTSSIARCVPFPHPRHTQRHACVHV